MRIVILGGTGQLGQSLVEALDHHNLHWPPHTTLDITDSWRTESYMRVLGPDVVINAAAFNDVKAAEADGDLAQSVNAIGAQNVAKACEYAGARLLHISTDYVFDGKKGEPYTESDVPEPTTAYGKSKLEGERLSVRCLEDTIVLRTAGLFGLTPTRSKPDGLNFVEAILRKAENGEEISVVDDIMCSPTSTEDLARQIAEIIDNDLKPGHYHAVNTPGCSWFDLAQLALSLAQIPATVRRIKSDSSEDGIQRPADTRLANTGLEQAGICTMRPLVSVVADYLARRDSLSSKAS